MANEYGPQDPTAQGPWGSQAVFNQPINSLKRRRVGAGPAQTNAAATESVFGAGGGDFAAPQGSVATPRPPLGSGGVSGDGPSGPFGGPVTQPGPPATPGPPQEPTTGGGPGKLPVTKAPVFSSPVTGTGIPAPAPVPAPAPGTSASTSPATGPVQPPPTAPPPPPPLNAQSVADPKVDPFASIGGGVYINGGWVPKGHPTAIAWLAANGGAGNGGGATPPPPITDPYKALAAQTTGTPADAFTTAGLVSKLPGGTYTPGEIAGFTAPNQADSDAAIHAQIMAILNNPALFGPQETAQLKEAQKETALTTSKDAFSQLREGAASRGVSVPLGEERRIADTTQQNILGAYRGIDVDVAEKNRAAIIDALKTASGLSTEQLNRATSGFNTNLDATKLREQTKLDAAKKIADDFFQTWTQTRGDLTQAQDNAAKQRQIDVQRELGMGDLEIQRGKLGEDTRQFDKMFPLNEAQILNNILLGKLNYGLNVADLNLRGGQSLSDWFANAFK